MAESAYPGNSNRSKTGPVVKLNEKPEVQKVVTNPVSQRKAPLGRRVRDQFAGDDAQTVGGYVLFEVLIPAAKNMLVEAGQQALERLFFGGDRPGRPSAAAPGYTPYGKIFRGQAVVQSNSNARTLSPQSRATHDFADILFATRVEVDEVVSKLSDLISQYDVATVADLYYLVGITPQFTDDNWGWDDIRHAQIRPGRQGYILDMPRPIALNKA